VRTQLECLIVSDQEAASEVQVVAIGGAIVSDQAVAIGVTAVPTPVTDIGSDLFFFYQMMMSSIVVGATPGSTTEDKTYSIDSRGMRKVDGDQDLIVVAEISSAIGSGATLFSAGRVLLKLH